MTKLCDINPGAKEKLPPVFAEKSGIGSHYVDAFLKPMNTKLPDGTRVGCKRKGLKVTLTVGTKKGDGLMRRLDVSKDPDGDVERGVAGSGEGRRSSIANHRLGNPDCGLRSE